MRGAARLDFRDGDCLDFISTSDGRLDQLNLVTESSGH